MKIDNPQKADKYPEEKEEKTKEETDQIEF